MSTIGSACLPVESVDPKRLFRAAAFTYIDIAAVDQVEKIIREAKRLPVATAPSRARLRVQEGDILVSTVRPNLNAVAQVWGFEDAIASTGFCVLRADERKLTSRYLFHWVKSPKFIAEMVRVAAGASYPAVTDRIVRSSQIPLPSLDEQRRIAAMLDKAEELRTKRRAALALLDQLPQAIFLEMFGDPIDNPRGWPAERLGSVAQTTSGGTPNRKIDAFYGGTIPWVKSGELHQGTVTRSEEHITEEAIRGSSAKLMPPGTILVAMYGATVGAIAELGISASTNQAVCCIQPCKRLSGTYLKAFLRSQTGRLVSQRVGGAQPNLSQDLIRSLEVILPPLEFQNEFGKRVEAIHRAKAANHVALAQLDVLFASLQSSAFSGDHG